MRGQSDKPHATWNPFIKTFSSFKATPEQISVIFAVVIGLLAALGAYVYDWLIHTVTHFCLGGSGVEEHGAFSFLGRYVVLILPALGGLVAGPIIFFCAREAKGDGVPNVITSVLRKGGRIRPRVPLVKAITSAITIGSGGSAGSEAPIVQIGAGIGSTLGQWFKMPPHRITNFLACGAASGIASIFHAPIAGVMFAMEVILGGFEKFSFIYVVLATVTASAASQFLSGNQAIFWIRYFEPASGVQLLSFALLGVLIAYGARYFAVVFIGMEDFFDHRLRMKESLKPAIGGICVGAIALVVTLYLNAPGKRILGVGYDTIDLALQGKLALRVLLILLVAKLFATSLTLGSGGSGGVLAPSLYMGAMLGGAYGIVLNKFVPAAAAPPVEYAVIGMGAFFAGAAHCPITAILIMFEMTGYRYNILLPIMACTVISTLVSSLMHRDSIYTITLRRAGIIGGKEKYDPLRSMVVGDVMIRDPQYITENMDIETLVAMVGKELHTSLPVVDAEKRIVGLMTYKEIHRAVASGRDYTIATVREFMKKSPTVVFTDESCADAFSRMKNAAQGIAPVVKRKDPEKIVGVITYRHIYESYQKALMY